jgi:hypothetical protein
MIRAILAAILLLTAGPALAQSDEDWSSRTHHDGVHLRILNNYELAATATAREPIVVIGGSATINGRAEDDVVVLGGTLRLGPTAVVRGDVVAVGGEAIIDPAAQISGEITRTVMMGPDWDLGGMGWLTDGWWAAFAFGATLLRLGIVLVIAMLLTVVAPGWINSIAQRASSMPLGSAAIGVAGQVLFVPGLIAVTVALVMSVIGILLLVAYPFVLGAAALLWVAGYAAVAANLGSRLRGREAGVSGAPILDLLIGFALISAVTVLAHSVALGSGPGPLMWILRGTGWLIEWMAWTMGLGAALAALFGGRQPVTPPAIPYATPAPTSF